ncbi:hypothetical protein Btru_069384 [Bulinus truncatus]|nr:hypothetical protein Btru_069384 [Bulinus truncatus]
MSDNEIEDGECTNSDTDNDELCHQDSRPAPINLYRNIPGHRPQIPQITINSEDSDSSEDESPSELKRARSNPIKCDAQGTGGVEVPFINPLLSNESMCVDYNPGNSTRKKNNIWSSVITEQVLSQEIQTFTVNKSLASCRDVETYDFTKAKEDSRPNVEVVPEVNNDDIFEDVEIDKDGKGNLHGSRKRKSNFGKKRNKITPKHEKLDVNVSRSVQQIVSSITNNLLEPKVELFTRIVETIGSDAALRLYNMTVDVEEAGGMLTNDGYRRRTAGGVFIQLLKTDSSVTKEMINSIFEQNHLEWKKNLREKRKIKKAARKKWKKQQKQKKIDIDRPETPGEELDGLNSVDSNNEFDAADLIDRPATPEPKDVSSDSQGLDEDAEEEDDIATAIQKAKEAILRRQEKLAQEQMEEHLNSIYHI